MALVERRCTKKLKLFSVFALLALLLGASSGAVVAQEPPPPDDPSTRGFYGTIHVPKDESAYDYADDVREAHSHGCNDYWAVFYSAWVDLPSGVWADNLVNQQHINRQDPPGLYGYYRCSPDGGCITYLCTKHGWGANAWSVKVRW